LHTNRHLLITTALIIGVVASTASAQTTNSTSKVLIKAAKPYSSVASTISSLGGSVVYQYKYVDAIAAEIPTSALTALRNVVGTGAITKDELIALPGTVDPSRGRKPGSGSVVYEAVADSFQALGGDAIQQLATATPSAYLLNNSLANVSSLHASGITGAGVIVAVIDSGIRPGFPHISLDGSVIGCEDFVNDGLGCSNSGNNFHGTFVAGMISANVVFGFSTSNAIRNAVLAECPACFSNPPINTAIPMIGTAPLSSLYALRVFGATGGAPTSRILAAMERAIDLREKFDAGLPGGSNVQVVNMSLGGSTVFPGRDLLDMEADVMLQKGIVPTISAGNAGPSSITVGSPATSSSAITVGAASLAHNERILRRLQLGPTAGALYRPFLGAQTAFFSSRGPDADGRTDPDVVSNGFASYGQGSGSTNTITFASGTSFSSPSVAGVAALLRQAHPTATAVQIRNAILDTANSALLADGSNAFDQGHGYVDGAAASALIASGGASNVAPTLGKATKTVTSNIERSTPLVVLNAPVFQHAADLKPGQRQDILLQVAPNTKQVIITLSGVTPALPPSQQNQLFGDDILLAVHSAKTSEIGEGDYKVFEFTTGGTFTVDAPETGVMRVTLNGDWTNAGTISADVSIISVTEPVPQFSAQGKIAEAQFLAFPINIPAGVSNAEFRLSWREDWGNVPTNDIDLVVVSPSGQANVDGATLNNPELAVINNPGAGTWTAFIIGFEVPSQTDKFELRVSLDGKVVK
jgi:subtilisin family serine protease